MTKTYTTSLGNSLLSSSYSCDGVPLSSPNKHIDLTKDEFFSGHCCILNGRLYVRTGKETKRGYLSCIDLSSNNTIWRLEANFGHRSPIIIENGWLVIGYLVVDIETGNIAHDIRDYFNEFGGGSSGLTRLVNGNVLKAVNMKDSSKGLILFEIDSNELHKIEHDFCDFNSINLVGDHITYLSGNTLCSYSILNKNIDWTLIMDCDSLKSPILRVYGVTAYVVTPLVLIVIDIVKGTLIRTFDLSKVAQDGEGTLDFTNVAFNEKSIVLYKAVSVDSWIASIDINLWEATLFHKDRDIKSLSLCGDHIFYSNGNNEIFGLSVSKKEVCWKSVENITASAIVSDNNVLIVGSVIAGFTVFLI